LTFIHLGNDSVVDGLINFEKLRMMAKEIRHVCHMASHYYVSCSVHSVVFLLIVEINLMLKQNN